MKHYKDMHIRAHKDIETLKDDNFTLYMLLNGALAAQLREAFIKPLLMNLYTWLLSKYFESRMSGEKWAYDKYRDVEYRGDYLLQIIANKYFDIQEQNEGTYFSLCVAPSWQRIVWGVSVGYQ